eukprot:4335172-Pyramimonas_sp.AAC.1
MHYRQPRGVATPPAQTSSASFWAYFRTVLGTRCRQLEGGGGGAHLAGDGCGTSISGGPRRIRRTISYSGFQQGWGCHDLAYL